MSVSQSRLAELVGQASLISIDLIQQASNRGHGDATGALTPAPDLHGAITRTTLVPNEPTTEPALLLRFDIRWDTSAHPEPDCEPFAKAEVIYRVAYRFSGEAPSFDELVRFGESLGVHHAWPFARAKVQAMSLELGLPVVLLPLHRLPE